MWLIDQAAAAAHLVARRCAGRCASRGCRSPPRACRSRWARSTASPCSLAMRDVEVVDLAEAVAAERERVGVMRPSPHSPASKAFFQPCIGAGVAVGHDHLGDRRPVQDAGRTWRRRCRRRSRPGAGPAPRRGRSRPGATTSASGRGCPSTVKLGPSGWVIGDGSQVGAQRPDVVGAVASAGGGDGHRVDARRAWSMTSMTSPRPRSTCTMTPSIGRA